MSQLGLFAEQLVTETSAAATHWHECLQRWHLAWPNVYKYTDPAVYKAACDAWRLTRPLDYPPYRPKR